MVSAPDPESGDKELSELEHKTPVQSVDRDTSTESTVSPLGHSYGTDGQTMTSDDFDDALAVFMQSSDEVGKASATRELKVRQEQRKIRQRVLMLFGLATLTALIYVMFPVSLF